uniref:Potassium/proton antiporter CemA n=1 Tax=Lobosphaera incisa TaxID=312850 RepID=A0A0U1XS83_9CHLO|nr:chloroplast envelope membrane protein [Lobosphaera incisa]
MEKRAFEQTGLVPRSIIRTFDRFRKQLFPNANQLVIREFRISRYQVLVSVKSLIALISIPLLVNFLVKTLLLTPLTEYIWNNQQTEVFLNSYQEERAFLEMQEFEDKLFFENLIFSKKKDFKNVKIDNFKPQEIEIEPYWYGVPTSPSRLSGMIIKYQTNLSFKINEGFQYIENLNQIFDLHDLKTCSWCLIPVSNTSGIAPTPNIRSCEDGISCPYEVPNALLRYFEPAQKSRYFVPVNFLKLKDFFLDINFGDNELINKSLKQDFQTKTLELAIYYNQQSIEAITNVFGDFTTFITISLLFFLMRPQIIILKSFLTESIYSLSDTTKSFLLILLTDLLVGFHSPRGWEIFIEIVLRHFGLPENQDFIFLFVATFPVLLDTVFKYWIFRYLNQISPSTVATYHSMIE